MSEIEFGYESFPHFRQGTIYRPYAQVELATATACLRLSMLIDSGADVSVLPKSIGEGS